MKRPNRKELTVFLIQKLKDFRIFVGHFLFVQSCRWRRNLIVKIYTFPPNGSFQAWRCPTASELGWDLVKLAELLAWLPEQDTRAFIILKRWKNLY